MSAVLVPLAEVLEPLTTRAETWETAEYIAMAGVFAGTLGQAVVEFGRWIENDVRKSVITRISLAVLIFSALLIWLATAKANGINDLEIAHLNVRAEHATLLAGQLWLAQHARFL
jgi:H+/Cl- antiporter ClcA